MRLSRLDYHFIWVRLGYKLGLSKTVELSHFYRKFALKGKYIALWISINLLKNRRTLLGLTQQDLTDYTGLSPQIIKSIETGKQIHKRSYQERLHRFLRNN